jgi:hypothetical protein
MSEETTKYAVETRQATPVTLLNLAIDQGADLDRLEKLMALQEKWEKLQAQKAYTVAMAGFKKNPPSIGKDKHVHYSTAKGPTDYRHASLGNVTSKINAALGEHGLSAAWTIDQGDKGSITVTCVITHVMGHSESTSLTAFPDDSGGKNTIQAVGSTISYLQRYTLLSLTGLASQDQDDDGSGATVVYIDDKMLSTITDLINEKSVDTKKFLEYLGVESTDKIQAKDFKKAMAALRAAKGTQKTA